MERIVLIGAALVVTLWGMPAWAVDESVIQELQTDVTVTKTKTDEHDSKIRSLEG